jgi:putative addiction module component (TIGR02574 family)
MSATENVFNSALSLPLPERAQLAHRLLRSLEAEGYDADWEAAWTAEIEKRLDAMDRGEYELIDRNEAIEEIRRSLKAGRPT